MLHKPLQRMGCYKIWNLLFTITYQDIRKSIIKCFHKCMYSSNIPESSPNLFLCNLRKKFGSTEIENKPVVFMLCIQFWVQKQKSIRNQLWRGLFKKFIIKRYGCVNFAFIAYNNIGSDTKIAYHYTVEVARGCVKKANV